MTSNAEAAVLLSSTTGAGVTTLTLHRPHRRNAIDHALVEALQAALTTAEARGDRVVVLTGGDAFFSSGGDVATMPGAADGLFGPAARLARVHEAVQRIVRSDVLVVAAVEGYAIGVAWGLVLACDLVVCADDARFSAPFARRGLTADGGLAHHLAERLGHQRASAHLLLGDPLSAADARTAGLVTELVAPGAATARAQELAAALAAGPSESNALTKRLLNHGRGPALDAFLAVERTAVALAGQGPDAAEGRAAFTERRDPHFA